MVRYIALDLQRSIQNPSDRGRRTAALRPWHAIPESDAATRRCSNVAPGTVKLPQMVNLTSAPFPEPRSSYPGKRQDGGTRTTEIPLLPVGTDRNPAVGPVLTALWLSLAVIRFAAAMFVASPSIFTDELTYWSLARSLHHGMRLIAFNGYYDIPTQLYP